MAFQKVNMTLNKGLSQGVEALSDSKGDCRSTIQSDWSERSFTTNLGIYLQG